MTAVSSWPNEKLTCRLPRGGLRNASFARAHPYECAQAQLIKLRTSGRGSNHQAPGQRVADANANSA